MSKEKDIQIGENTFARPGKRKKHLKVYHTLYETNMRDVPKMLRKLAKNIEAGEYGVVDQVALVASTEKHGITLFGYGDTSGSGTYLLLSLGAKWLLDETYNRMMKEV